MTTDNVPPLCLEGVLSFISGINERSKNLKKLNKNDLVEKKQKIAFLLNVQNYLMKTLNWELNNWQLMGLLKMVMI